MTKRDELDDALTALPEPGVQRPREQLAWQFAMQARAYRTMGSELSTNLLTRAIADVTDRGPTWRLVRDHVATGRSNAIALRVLAAVHRLALTGQAPAAGTIFCRLRRGCGPNGCLAARPRAVGGS